MVEPFFSSHAVNTAMAPAINHKTGRSIIISPYWPVRPLNDINAFWLKLRLYPSAVSRSRSSQQ